MTLTLALTCGEPAGIGAEVALKALAAGLPPGVEAVLVGPRAVWAGAAGLVPGGFDLGRWRIREPEEEGTSEQADWSWGRPTVRSGRTAAEAVELAARLALVGEVDALVTAPLSKEGLHAAGRPFPGHTELLASLCGPGHRAVMMLAGPRLRVFLVTTHLPLARVPDQVTREAVLATVAAAHRGLERDLGIASPRIAVCALNPHGGEGGVLGSEERDVIAPALEEARAAEIRAVGPLPADSAFHRAAEGEFDAVVAMYHDQGLAPLKLLHFWDGVNVTLNLPLVRTSPDHGTALDLAGRGAARADSFREAIRWAADIACRRRAARGTPGTRHPAPGTRHGSSPMTIRFGTDGWRGVMARDFTFANVRRVSAAIGAYLEAEGTAARGVAVAWDRRLLSDRFAAEAAGVLAARGIPVRLAGAPEPTPLLSWAVRHQGLAGGIGITASHNPPEWNGIKLKEPFGGAARASVSQAVEEHLEAQPPGDEIPCLSTEEARERGLLAELDAWQGYREALGRLVDFDALRRAGLPVAVDAMHGCGSPGLRRLLEEAGCRVRELRGEWNPGFGGASPEPVEAHLSGLAAAVRDGGCALGLANDGDADRIAAVDERGRYFSPQRILAVLLRYLREEKGLPGGAVKAVSATSLVDLLAERYGMEVTLTPIGFKHIGEAMLERPTLIGGEESGGIGIPAHLPERDGLLNALLLAEIVARTGRGLRAYLQEIFDRVGYFTYDRLDLPLDPAAAPAVRARIAALEDPPSLCGGRVAQVLRLDGTRFLRDDASWLLVRPSGTEPLLRIYAEARSREEVRELIEEGKRMARCT